MEGLRDGSLLQPGCGPAVPAPKPVRFLPYCAVSGPVSGAADTVISKTGTAPVSRSFLCVVVWGIWKHILDIAEE